MKSIKAGPQTPKGGFNTMLLRLLFPLYKGDNGDLTVRLMAITILLFSTIGVEAQQSMDSTQLKAAGTEVQKQEGKKSKGKKKEKTPDAVAAATDSTQAPSKKTKSKKKGKDTAAEATKHDSASTTTDSTKALPKALKNYKAPKTTAKKATPKKPPKAPPAVAEPKIIPGAEARANAETKDKEDRTMKGPSGQKVYTSPKGGKYYFDVNGNKKYLKHDIPIKK